MRQRAYALALACAGLAYAGTAQAATEPAPNKQDTRPNILVILADDLGYSDIGAFGGEISTPNLDALAQQGRILTNMQVGAACSPTRAMLMSGADHHLVGLGQMAEYTGALTARGTGKVPLKQSKPSDYQPFGTDITFDNVPAGYAGYLNDQALSMPELLRDAGYNTYMAGKWHLAYAVGVTDDKPGVYVQPRPESMPDKKGFEKSFVLLNGGGAHFAPVAGKPIPMDYGMYAVDGKTMPASDLPKDFFSTDYYTDQLIAFIGKREQARKPFFAYAAYTAPHWPLQAPAKYLEAQKGRYDEGYEVIRNRRIEKMKQLGLLPKAFQPSPMLPSKAEGGQGMAKWEELSESQRAYQARVMEVYAAMVSNLDDNVGRLIAHLKKIGEYDNTMIVFLSDNGPEGTYFMGRYQTNIGNVNNDVDNLGHPLSMIEYGERWAEVSATPFRMWKANTGAEGGTSAPGIVRMPAQSQGQKPLTGLAHITDVLPTVLDLAQVDNPGNQYAGREVHPISGVSWLPALQQENAAIRSEDDVLADELFFRSYVKKGKWKLSRNPEIAQPGPDLGANADGSRTPISEVQWKLFDLEADRGETTDVADQHPEVVKALLAEWDKYVEANGVRMLDSALILPRGTDPKREP